MPTKPASAPEIRNSRSWIEPIETPPALADPGDEPTAGPRSPIVFADQEPDDDRGRDREEQQPRQVRPRRDAELRTHIAEPGPGRELVGPQVDVLPRRRVRELEGTLSAHADEADRDAVQHDRGHDLVGPVFTFKIPGIAAQIIPPSIAAISTAAQAAGRAGSPA
jgi:hypothetical protein